MKWETSVSLTYFKYKTISHIIQIFVADFVASLLVSTLSLRKVCIMTSLRQVLAVSTLQISPIDYLGDYPYILGKHTKKDFYDK